MKKAAQKNINLVQYILTINGAQVGGGILTLPAQLAGMAGTDGWISLIIGWLVTVAASLCVIGIMSKHPGETMLEILTRYIGKWAATVWMLIWILYSLLALMTLLYFTLLVLEIWVLPGTNIVSLGILLLIPAYMVARHGVHILGRYAVFVFFFTLWLPALLTIPLRESHIVFILPLLKEGWLPIFYAAKTTVLAFIGFEAAFILYPYLSAKRGAARGIVIASCITLVVYLHITLMCFVYFSPDEITEYIWPALTLVKPIEFTFLERFEIIFLSFYILFFSTSCFPYLLTTLQSINQIVHKKDWQLPIYVLLLSIIVSLFFYRPTYNQFEAIRALWGRAGYVIAYAFPALFFLYAAVRTRFRRRSTE
ncbi:endospore germination permease [Aneurinibacillus sp. BA2021]|nr:endospore germination permease [Aneurinibacillus sp. BA2021]